LRLNPARARCPTGGEGQYCSHVEAASGRGAMARASETGEAILIIGIGVDHARIDRVSRLMRRYPDRSRDRLFTNAERTDCEARPRSEECYAARFAAKEAFVKALGTGLREGLRWTDIEVRTDRRGRPELGLHGAALRAFKQAGGQRTHLSFTHEGGVAAAIVVLEGA